MRLPDLVEHLDLPATQVADGAWDVASARVRRRRAAVAATAATTVAVVAVAIAAATQGDGGPHPPANTPSPSSPSPSSPSPSQTETDPVVDGRDARPDQVIIDPDDPDRRAVLWWSCDACDSLTGALVLTEDAFADRTVIPIDAETGLAWAGDEQVALIDWDAGTIDLMTFDGARRTLRLGSEAAAPAGSIIIEAPIDAVWQSVWIDAAAATAHPVPRPAEAAEAGDGSLWRDANGLVWFGSDEDDNIIATSEDGGVSWTSHSLGSGYMLPTYSGAEGVLAVLEYEDADRERLPFLRAWYSIDGGDTWARTEEGSGPAAPVDAQGGMVRADGRLIMHAPGNAGLIVMDDAWTYFEPAAWTPGNSGQFDLLSMQGWGDSLTVIGRPSNSADVYTSATPGDDWTPLTVR